MRMVRSIFTNKLNVKELNYLSQLGYKQKPHMRETEEIQKLKDNRWKGYTRNN